jgi:hypothetical protein
VINLRRVRYEILVIIIIVIKLYWPRHIQILGKLLGEWRYSHKILVGNTERKRHRKNNINYILKKLDMRTWIGFIWLKIGTTGEMM